MASSNVSSADSVSNVADEDRCWVRLAALSYDATVAHIHQLCKSLNLRVAAEPDSEDPVIILLASARPSGMVIIHFCDAEEAEKATTALQGHHFSGRRLQCRLLTRHAVLDEIQRMACRKPAPAPGSDLPVGVDRRIKSPEQFIEQEKTGRCIKLVGIPFGSPVEEVVRFLMPYRAVTLYFLTHGGRPTGNCIVEIEDGLAALRAVHGRHRRYIGSRFVEVYPARPCDLYCDSSERPIVIGSDDLMMPLVNAAGDETDKYPMDNVNINQHFGGAAPAPYHSWQASTSPISDQVPTGPYHHPLQQPQYPYPHQQHHQQVLSSHPSHYYTPQGPSFAYNVPLEAHHYDCPFTNPHSIRPSYTSPAPHHALLPAAPMVTSFQPSYLPTPPFAAAPPTPPSTHTPYSYTGVDLELPPVDGASYPTIDSSSQQSSSRQSFAAQQPDTIGYHPHQTMAVGSGVVHQHHQHVNPQQNFYASHHHIHQPGMASGHTAVRPSAHLSSPSIISAQTPAPFGLIPSNGSSSSVGCSSCPSHPLPPVSCTATTTSPPSSCCPPPSTCVPPAIMKREEESEASWTCCEEDYGYMPTALPQSSCLSFASHPAVTCTHNYEPSCCSVAPACETSPCCPRSSSFCWTSNAVILPATPTHSSDHASDDSRMMHQPYQWPTSSEMPDSAGVTAASPPHHGAGNLSGDATHEHFAGCIPLNHPTVMRSSELIAWASTSVSSRS